MDRANQKILEKQFDVEDNDELLELLERDDEAAEQYLEQMSMEAMLTSLVEVERRQLSI